jgi:hypothetical protein
MKTKLLTAFILFSIAGLSQNPITTFYGDTGPYAIGIVAAPLNESAVGPNVVWNFNQIGQNGTAAHIHRTPTAAELVSYPGTTDVLEITSTVSGIDAVSQLYTASPASVVSIKAIKNETLQLNYITNNATMGAFPMSYGFTNTDNTAGTYVYGTYTGTFSGTIATSVDAYGTLSASIGNIPANTPVTRLKTVQTASLNYSIFTNVGTGTQTTYSYYWNNGTDVSIPLLNSSVTYINVPLLSINQTVTGIEAFSGPVLATSQNELEANMLKLFPNPVADLLQIQVGKQQKIYSAAITDMAGRIVYQSNSGEKSIDMNFLQQGVYSVTIDSDLGKFTQKIIKK